MITLETDQAILDNLEDLAANTIADVEIKILATDDYDGSRVYDLEFVLIDMINSKRLSVAEYIGAETIREGLFELLKKINVKDLP